MYKLDIKPAEVLRVTRVEGILGVYFNLRIEKPNSPWGYRDAIIPGDTVELKLERIIETSLTHTLNPSQYRSRLSFR
jgi:hypothetical protein